jgi:hypothetical protein
LRIPVWSETYRFPAFEARLILPDAMEGYSGEWVSRSLLSVLPGWGEEAECLKAVMSQRGHLLVFHVQWESPHHLLTKLIDIVDTNGLNLTMDPRMVPAKIGDWLYTADQNPTWDTIIILCAFDSLVTRKVVKNGTYPLWDVAQVRVSVAPKKRSIRIREFLGVPIRVERGLLV